MSFARAAMVLFPVLLSPLAALPQEGPKDAPKAGEERAFEVAAGVKMVFCYIPPGKATLGSPKTEVKRDADEAEREYTSTGFWLGKYEVTQAEWRAVTGQSPSDFDGKKSNKAKGLDTARFPVDTVSWNDCRGFLDKVNGRPGAGKAFGPAGKFALPHEDEWEYAARGGKGNKQPFLWGNSLNGAEANVDGRYPYGTDREGRYLERTCPVDDTNAGNYPAHPWGLHHMTGNVWEWCENEYAKGERVLRGGSWDNGGTSGRPALRNRFAPSSANRRIGFRVCFRPDR